MGRVSRALRGAVPSPNIWRNPAIYEVHNRAVDPDGALDAAMRSLRDWQGADVADIGCGTGFHLPVFARTARSVHGVEPHTALARAARSRTSGLENVRVRRGLAQDLPLADASADVAHARWAYFFGPGCEPGLAELRRVLRRGGVAFVIDNDATRSTFGAWFRRGLPSYDPGRVERFWSMHGFQRRSIDMRWRFERREDFESVLGIEFPPELAAEIAATHRGLEVDYAVNLWWRRYP
jgi:SAM-dependent methyltransferase